MADASVQVGEAVARAAFDQARVRLARLAGRLVSDADAAVADAERAFAGLLPDLGYRDTPTHPLANALFTAAVNLSLYLVLLDRGVDAHTFGRALLTGLARAPLPPPSVETDDERARRLEAFAQAAVASARAPRAGEDVFDYLPNGDGDFAFDVRVCATFALFAHHGAEDVMPYLCAVDDVMSEKTGQGLRRHGSLALGASHCDFRYRAGGAPLTLADQYPERIRLVALD